jgi:hypothetical protein
MAGAHEPDAGRSGAAAGFANMRTLPRFDVLPRLIDGG